MKSKYSAIYITLTILLTISYNIYLDYANIKPKGNNLDFIFWWMLFFISFLISTIITIIGIFKNIKYLWYYILYSIFIYSSTFFSNDVKYIKRYIQSIYYTKVTSSCQDKISDFKICYHLISDPVVEFIILSGDKIFTKENNQKLGDDFILNKISKEHPQYANYINNYNIKIYHLYDNAYYLTTN